MFLVLASLFVPIFVGTILVRVIPDPVVRGPIFPGPTHLRIQPRLILIELLPRPTPLWILPRRIRLRPREVLFRDLPQPRLLKSILYELRHVLLVLLLLFLLLHTLLAYA
jgi:hypothetical protein